MRLNGVNPTQVKVEIYALDLHVWNIGIPHTLRHVYIIIVWSDVILIFFRKARKTIYTNEVFRPIFLASFLLRGLERGSIDSNSCVASSLKAVSREIHSTNLRCWALSYGSFDNLATIIEGKFTDVVCDRMTMQFCK